MGRVRSASWRFTARPSLEEMSRHGKRLFYFLFPVPYSLFPIPYSLASILLAALVLFAGMSARAEIQPSQVLVLVNNDTKISSEVAQMYQKLREIPAANILRLSLGTSREISRDEFRTRIAGPVRKFLESNPAIRCILTTSGFPYVFQAPSEEGAAVDNELATVLRAEPKDRKRGQPNPLFLHGINSYAITDPRRMKMVFVTRLDGPDLKTITRMAEDAIATEKSGLQGPVYGDAQGLDGVTGYGEGDASIRAAIDRLSGAGFESKLDLKQETWLQPKGGVGYQAAGAAFYVGWYKYRDFQDIFGRQGLARGAIAWHIASGEAANLWDPNERGWCVNLLRRGAAVTLGPVREPYVTAFPHGDIFLESLLTGATIAESYWLALPQVSWNMVILGDPLYRPFALKPKPSLVARAYVSTDPNHVLEKGKTSSLLVQLECVGPTGSATPAMTAVAAPEMGLAAASGTVTIPPLKAGEAAVLRVPSVTAGNDPSGMFRLILQVQNDGEKFRRIVLEGRTGFSRLTGGLLSKSQMFVSPSGLQVISGEPGKSRLFDTETLRSVPIVPPKGFALIGAEFSRNGSHIALALLNLQQKKAGVVISDNKLGNVQALPAGFRFQRWIEEDEVLLQGPNGPILHSVGGGEDRAVDVPTGWSATIIPGTKVELLGTKDGKLAFKKASAPLQEVLQGVKATQFTAIADDLSMFGGVDAERRLWVQHGLGESPKVLATGVERVLWGPISRRVMVEDTGGKSRVYDGRDNTWMDLGVVLGAQWSPDEEKLLFIGTGEPADRATPDFVSLLSNRRIFRLCPLARIGYLTAAAFSADGGKAFLLAGLGGGTDVWMMALPAQSAPETKLLPFHSQRSIVIAH